MTDFKKAVAEVKVAYAIEDYIQASGVRLKSSGPTKFKGLCPFHNEKSPSFTVDSHFQNYRCFGCGANGDLLQFVMQTEHLEFFDALKKLAEDKNITLDIKEERSGVDYSSLRECMRAISNFFVKEYRKLPDSHPAKQEVASRGLAKSKFLFGYAPEGRQTLYRHLKDLNFSDEVILLTGACVQFEGKKDIFDFWHGRLMFFITDVTGKPIGWSGRKLYETDKRGKYVNSRDGVLFDKGASLFHLSQAKKKAAEDKCVFVNEGQFDVAASAEAGKLNTVASSGTAFTEKQGMMLRRLVGEDGRIVFCFDGDTAGIKAAMTVFKNVPGIHSQAYVVLMPEGQDPCDYRLEHGDEALAELMDSKQVPLVEFVLDQTKANFDLLNDLEKTKYVQAASKILKTVSNNVLRETYTKKVSLDSFTNMETVRSEVAKAEPLRNEGPQAQEADTEEPTVPVEVLASPEEAAEEKTVEDIEALMLEDVVYGMAARLLFLALSEPALSPAIGDLRKHIPEEFHSIIDDLLQRDSNEPVIPESFTHSALVAALLSHDYFPFIHLMGEDEKRNQYSYLERKLVDTIRNRKVSTVKNKVAAVLQKAEGAAYLDKALETEARGIAAVEASL